VAKVDYGDPLDYSEELSQVREFGLMPLRGDVENDTLSVLTSFENMDTLRAVREEKTLMVYKSYQLNSDKHDSTILPIVFQKEVVSIVFFRVPQGRCLM